jgi:hypothetical protein
VRKKLKNRKNKKKIIKKPNREKNPIKILKKPAGLVRFQFYKPKTEPNPSRKKLSQTDLNRFWFGLKK